MLTLRSESQELCILNTHKGLFKFTSLIYGVASAPGIFQSVIDQVLFGLKGVICYLDNILVKGATCLNVFIVLCWCWLDLKDIMSDFARANVSGF